VADIEKDRDWDKEMAEVDRLLKKLPAADPTLGRASGGEPTVRRPAAAPSSGGGAPSARDRVGTWVKVALGVLVGIGIAPGVWPYSHGCGLRLIFYLVGVTTVIAAGLWASISSWKRRLGFAHVVSQILIVWGILLMTREVLPRVGAKAAALWLCPDVPLPR
jgi:hypothetical protein